MREQKECMKYINSLKFGESKEEICKLRTQYCVQWYTKKAVLNKRLFILLSIANVAIPQISTIVVLLNERSLFSAILSAVVSFSTALLALLNVKDRWTSYRSTAEIIKRQYTLYCVQAPPFQGDDAHIIYLAMIEQYMAEEHGHWREAQKKAPGQEGTEGQTEEGS